MNYSDINDEINDLEAYTKLFQNKQTSDGSKINELKKNALEKALDIRKFEIELYWKRAAYFWTFIALTFTSYFIVLQSKEIEMVYKDKLLLILSFLGLFFSLAWFFANKGSKYWQENWEKHVDLLEDDIIGPLYKTTLNYKYSKCDWINPLTSYKYSVGKINQLISFSIVLLWAYIHIHQVILMMNQKKFTSSIDYIVIVFFCFFLIIKLVFQTKSSDKKGGDFSLSKRNIKKS